MVEKGAVVKDSIIMAGTIIGENALVDHCVIDEKCSIGKNVQMGVGENIPNEAKPNIYNTGITVLGMNSSVPDGIVMGKNCVIYGRTFPEDYPDGTEPCRACIAGIRREYEQAALLSAEVPPFG